MEAGRVPEHAPTPLRVESWEEGSHLKEYPYKYTGGTGKYEGATGGGTYTMEELTDTLLGGRYKGELILR